MGGMPNDDEEQSSSKRGTLTDQDKKFLIDPTTLEFNNKLEIERVEQQAISVQSSGELDF